MKMKSTRRNKTWGELSITRKYPLSPSRIEEAMNFFEAEDSLMNCKKDTVFLERERHQEIEDGFDNLVDEGWFYND
jgi:hypothetical protein